MTDYGAQELVDAFLAEAGVACAFLESEHGLTRTVDVRVVAGGGLEPVDPGAAGHGRFFFATVAYAGPAARVEITYGDREFALRVLVDRPDAGAYGLGEWLEAVGVTDPPPAEELWVRTPERLREVLSRDAAALRDGLPALLAADEATVERMRAAREARRRANVRRMEEWEHQRVAALAARAFREGDYEAVVRLLGGIEDRLTPSERKKLDYARRQGA